ncbi:MAG: ATP-dependent helicase [Deltaproteobacteria bacterium]|nr:ATP-dependent helicase [Deltaproteobacteria bacterium]
MTPVFTSDKLNPEQKAAVRATEGPCLVVAGPGSGKTRTLGAKALHILRHHTERKILCITHTRKAADEMRARIRKHLNTHAIEISTIHSLCYKILRKSLGKPIRIVSDYDHAAIVRIAAERACLEMEQRQAAALISQAKLGLVGKQDEIKKLLKEYDRLKGDRLDYDDLLLLALKKLRRDKEERKAWSHILVDEAQDLDPIQIKLIRHFGGKRSNITFFLDYNQAIFSFKGAVPDEIARIANIYPNTRKFYLLRNHRSTGKILNSANRLIRINGSENPSIPMRGEGADPVWVKVADENAEAELAAEIAGELIREGLKPREIIMLYRTNHYRAEIENELIEREVPYSILKNTSIFKKEGPFLPLCLKAWRPKDEWEQPLLVHYIGRKNAAEIGSLARELGLSPLECAIQEGIRRSEIDKAVDLLLRDLREIQVHRDKTPLAVAEAAWEIVERRGFFVDVKEIRGLLRILGRFQSLGELISRIETLDMLSQAPREKKVHLSTIHRAKGLEHRAVILLGCVEGKLPLQVGEEMNIPEERRLAYVALTRARDRFIAIAPQTVYGKEAAPSRFLREMGLKQANWL